MAATVTVRSMRRTRCSCLIFRLGILIIYTLLSSVSLSLFGFFLPSQSSPPSSLSPPRRLLLPLLEFFFVYAAPNSHLFTVNGKTIHDRPHIQQYDPNTHAVIHAVESSHMLIANQQHDSENRNSKEKDNSILVVIAVDGTLAGIDRATGKLLWKRHNSLTTTTPSASQTVNRDDLHNSAKTTTTTSSTTGRMPPKGHDANSNNKNNINNNDNPSVFRPLLSTTTTAQTATTTASGDYAAVPCINGNVYLTSHSQTVSTSIKELVRRAPFLDPQGKFYAGNHQTTAVAIDPGTGQLLHVMGYQQQETDDVHDDDQEQQHSQSSSRRPPWKDSSDSDDSTLWIGRVDYSVSVQDARTGRKTVEFSVAEIMPVHDFGTARPVNTGDDDDNNGNGDNRADVDDSSHISVAEMKDRLVSTPSGTLAMVDLAGRVQWVVEESFSTPIAYGISSNGRQIFYVDIVPDVVVPSSNDVEYLSRQLERQVELIDSDDYGQESDAQTIVGRLDGSGQLYALPLGRQRPERAATSLLPHLTKSHHAAAIASSNKDHKSTVPLLAGGRTIHSLSQHSYDEQSWTRKPCHPTSSNFPSCLVDHHKLQPPRLDYFTRGKENRLIPEGLPTSSTKKTNSFVAAKHNGVMERESLPGYRHEHDAREQYGLERIVYDSEYGYMKFFSRPKPRKHKLWRIMGSWLPATIALIFVLSFELGRRKRLQELEGKITLQGSAGVASAAIMPSSTINESTFADTIITAAPDDDFQERHQQHVIQVTDQVLGYGGQGTVVYKGVLEGRAVAVKRMLKAYHANADREIRLLIESDGHPNVVRYFLKEVRGDFVYLALELCDLSLHDLIGVLRDSGPSSVCPMSTLVSATKLVLLQIASGVRHLHSLRIAHRDLKPANILLAMNKRKTKCGDSLEVFLSGLYVAKISDMGLGKQIMGPSSLGGSTMGTPSTQGNIGKAAASSIGVGPGTVGWQAPEVMATRWAVSDSSAKSGDSNPGQPTQDASPLEFSSSNPRTSRAVDIFSLGCIFYSTLVPGYHPFGEWYEREANIVHNRPAIDALEQVSSDAFDLVKAMLCRDPRLRPTAKQICEHPFFWNSARKLSFLCDFSDRLETDPTIPTSIQTVSSLSVERGAVDVVGTSWDIKLDEALISNMQRFRSYDPSSVRDLLRLIRNKHHHYDELPQEFRASKVANQDLLLEYFESKFPRLLMHCWNCCRTILTADDPLKEKYDIPTVLIEPAKTLPVGDAPDTMIVEGSHVDKDLDAAGWYQIDGSVTLGDYSNEPAAPVTDLEVDSSDYEKITIESESPEVNMRPVSPILEPSIDDVIVWVGSTTAKELKCRGWNRSDVEWARRIDPVYRKKDQNLRRASEDPKYRTRLCNHWDMSMGTFCAMRKRNKCIFAHGPVELRIKEGKKNRWGKLVDKNGDNKNPWHSGGEDTYGAARSIETTRKDEGKWNAGAGGKGVKGKKPTGRTTTKTMAQSSP